MSILITTILNSASGILVASISFNSFLGISGGIFYPFLSSFLFDFVYQVDVLGLPSLLRGLCDVVQSSRSPERGAPEMFLVYLSPAVVVES